MVTEGKNDSNHNNKTNFIIVIIFISRLPERHKPLELATTGFTYERTRFIRERTNGDDDNKP